MNDGKPKSYKGPRIAALGCVGVVAIFVFAIAIAVAEGGDSPTEQAVRTNSATTAPDRAVLDTLTGEQDKVVTFMRNAVMQTVVCKGSADQTQSAIDGIDAGRGQLIEAYQEAKRGIENCADAVAELGRPSLVELLPTDDRDLGTQALASCEKAAQQRKAAMEVVQTILDGDNSLATASSYLDLRSAASGDEAACRLSLVGLAERSRIPESVVDFAKP